MRINLDQTIVAPITSITKQAVSVIRISGKDSFSIVNKLLIKKIKHEKKTCVRELYFNNNLIDQVMLSCFVSPKSFTGEDIIEINCHGGVKLTQKIINLLISFGARMAMPGEFSQRSFLNGKINLIQAEGINDLINAKNNLALNISAKNMAGKANTFFYQIKNNLINIISKIQTAIDYPDYEETENITSQDIIKDLSSLKIEVEKIITDSMRASVVVNGIKTVIVGEPNVGKSSILNSLLNEEKAIVSDEKGTTRDIVEGEIAIDNISLSLIDTAGIHETNNAVEKKGIEKSFAKMEEADLILYVSPLPQKKDKFMEQFKFKKFIIVVNKKDLLNENQIYFLKNEFEDYNIVFTNAKDNDINELVDKIKDLFSTNDFELNNQTILTNIEQINYLKNVNDKIYKSLKTLKEGFTIDIINIDLYDALDDINNILGVQNNEEVLDNIFRKYCLGK